MSHWHDLFLNTFASRKWSWWPWSVTTPPKKQQQWILHDYLSHLCVGHCTTRASLSFTAGLWGTGTSSQLLDRDAGVAIELLMTSCRTSAVWKLRLLLCTRKKSSWVSSCCFLQHPGPSVSGDISVVLAAKGYMELPLGTPKHFIALQNELCRQQSFLMKPHCLTELTPAHCKLQEQL